MGTGKSTVGRRLARELNYRFLDIDTIIEEEAKSPIKDIFAAHGEKHFRDLERRVIRKLVSTGGVGIVASTGGGAVADASNRTALRAWATVVCLRASVDAILSRVGGGEGRPLLSSPGRRESIENLLKERTDAYRDCDLSVDTSSKTVEEVVAVIMDFIAKKDARDK